MRLPKPYSITACDGVRLVADVWNSDGEATLLLLPAGAETRGVWRRVTDYFDDDVFSRWRIVAADHRGHGDSGRSPSYGFDQFLGDLLSWTAELDADPLVIAGGSIGGALGMVAAGEGAAISGLILLDVPVAPVLERVMLERSRVQSAAAAGHDSLTTIDARYIAGGFIEDVYRDIGRWRRSACALHVPTLLIAGSEGVIGPREVDEYRACIPHGELERLPTGHLVARDDPQGAARCVQSFLRKYFSERKHSASR